MATETRSDRDRPEMIRAVPVRHPGRWIAAVGVLVLAAMFVNMLLTNDAFQWSFVFDNLFNGPIVEGVWTAVKMTVLAMLIGIVLGVVIAVMRLSSNRLLSGAAWLYTWFFRAVPRIVLLVLFGNLGIDPTKRKILVVKSNQHFYASFSQIATHVIYAEGDGPLPRHYAKLPWRKVQRPIWPLDAQTEPRLIV